MFIIKYALPIASALLLILFFSALPALHVCTLPLDAPKEKHALPGADRRRFSRRDWAALLLILAAYAAAAFWQLGDTSGPETFASMAGESAEIQLQGEEAPEKILLFPGVGMGGYTVEYSEDGEAYTQVMTFDQGHIEVLKWTELTPETELRPRFVRLSCTSGNPWMGEVVLLDGEGRVIPTTSSIPALCDEQDTVPAAQSFMNSTYFDEIYHARTAWEHLHGIWPYEISHPPLGKLIISLGISLFGMTPFGWRFMGTLFGVLMLPVLYVLLKKMFGGTAIPALGTGLLATDFMHYTQTRIATIDTYAVFFILLMYLFMYLYLREGNLCALALSGVFFGLGAASKWTCIYAGAGLAVLWAGHWLLRAAGYQKPGLFAAFLRNSLFCVLFFVLVPALIYYLTYIPYGQAEGARLFSREYTKIVLDNQSFMFNYHVGVVAEHPYSSRWYQWILDIRPILYYLNYFDDGTRSSICAFVNPALCWGGLLSLFVLIYTAIFRRDRKAAFILIGYLAQLLPWIFIRRLTFEYHYFPATVFLVLALCYVFSLLRESRRGWLHYAVPFTCASLLLFILFFPALSGKPVDNATATKIMHWLPTWPL
ncbi:MAG: glycosyltransferase family 39 protein [Oscillospiraceae bacterium]|nr:glycosyltransferase family 39 protein [Oscillospiraceae bacterium]